MKFYLSDNDRIYTIERPEIHVFYIRIYPKFR